MVARKRIDPVAVEEDALLNFQFALIDAMAEVGMTKADLAKALGVTRARISQMFDSEANPTLKVIARAMTLLGRRVDYPVDAIETKSSIEIDRMEFGSMVAATRAANSDWAVQQHSSTTANENALGYSQLKAA